MIVKQENERNPSHLLGGLLINDDFGRYNLLSHLSLWKLNNNFSLNWTSLFENCNKVKIRCINLIVKKKLGFLHSLQLFIFATSLAALFSSSMSPSFFLSYLFSYSSSVTNFSANMNNKFKSTRWAILTRYLSTLSP
jgi:hypothetical protein